MGASMPISTNGTPDMCLPCWVKNRSTIEMSPLYRLCRSETQCHWSPIGRSTAKALTNHTHNNSGASRRAQASTLPVHRSNVNPFVALRVLNMLLNGPNLNHTAAPQDELRRSLVIGLFVGRKDLEGDCVHAPADQGSAEIGPESGVAVGAPTHGF